MGRCRAGTAPSRGVPTAEPKPLNGGAARPPALRLTSGATLISPEEISHAPMVTVPGLFGAPTRVSFCNRTEAMPARHLLPIVLLLGASSAGAAGERLNVEQLPPAVQRTLQATHYGTNVKEATRSVIDGRTVYQVEIEKNNAPNLQLRIAEDGTIVREPAVPLFGTADVPMTLPPESEMYVRLTLGDLPAPVQETVKAHAKGREVADIDRESSNGRTVYEVEFRERGLNSRIHVAEDGQLLRDERRGGNLWSRFMGLQLADVPGPVQDTIRRIAGNREIADIDRKGAKAAPVYRVEIKDAGATQELRVAHDGRLLYDSRAPAANAPTGKSDQAR